MIVLMLDLPPPTATRSTTRLHALRAAVYPVCATCQRLPTRLYPTTPYRRTITLPICCVARITRAYDEHSQLYFSNGRQRYLRHGQALPCSDPRLLRTVLTRFTACPGMTKQRCHYQATRTTAFNARLPLPAPVLPRTLRAPSHLGCGARLT